jgi:hypothetical protein
MCQYQHYHHHLTITDMKLRSRMVCVAPKDYDCNTIILTIIIILIISIDIDPGWVCHRSSTAAIASFPCRPCRSKTQLLRPRFSLFSARIRCAADACSSKARARRPRASRAAFAAVAESPARYAAHALCPTFVRYRKCCHNHHPMSHIASILHLLLDTPAPHRQYIGTAPKFVPHQHM